LREKALLLRKQNKSYSQIKNELNVPKSTLSSWLKNLPLSKERINELRGNNEARIEKFRQTMFKKREDRLNLILKSQKRNILPITNKELLITGLALYWGEGSKANWSKVALANTDPLVLNFFIYWLKSIYKIKLKKIKIALQLYSDMNINNEIRFWSKTLNISTKQFIKPYIKTTKLSRINHKGGFGHGTCIIMIYSVELKEKIMMQLKLLAEITIRKRL
jgi:hypothetical protein